MKRPINPGGQQRFVEGALDAIRPGRRERRAKRKSPWNLVGVIVVAPIMGPAGYGLWLCAWDCPAAERLLHRIALCSRTIDVLEEQAAIGGPLRRLSLAILKQLSY